MCNCNECNVSIVSGNYCHLCAKAMISTNNNSMEASMKTILFTSNALVNTVSASQPYSRCFVNFFTQVANYDVMVPAILYTKIDEALFGKITTSFSLKAKAVVETEEVTISASTLAYVLLFEYIRAFDSMRNEEDESVDYLNLGNTILSSEQYEEFYNDMCDDEDANLDYSERNTLSTHEGSYLEFQENSTLNIDSAKALLKTYEYDFSNMSDDLVIEIASQFKDLSEQGIAGSYKKDDRVKVTIQRKSTNGQWYTVKQDNVIADVDFGKTALAFFFEIEDLFEVDDNGNIIDFKMAADEEVTKLVQGMRKEGFRDIHMQYVGNNKYLPLEQRFLVSCQAFRSVERLCGVDLNQVCEPFYNTYNKETKEVEEAYISFAYDAITDLGNGIVILPSDNPESIEETLNRKYNEGILTGTAVATNFMAMADVEKSEIEENVEEEAKLRKEAKKEKAIAIKKDASLKARVQSDMYQVTVALIAKSENNEHVEFEPANLEEVLEIKGLTLAEQNKAKLKYFKEMLKCATTYRNQALKEARLNGRKAPNGFFGFSFKKDYKKLSLIINKYMEAVMIDAIKDSPDNILTNIESLNEGTRKINSFSIEELNGIYKSAKKYRDVLEQFEIKKEVAKVISSLIAA